MENPVEAINVASPILAPVVALIAWTLVMLLWMMVARTTGMKGVDQSKLAKPGLRGSDLDGVVPDKAQWPSHNYNHLMEQPTLFYALCLAMAALQIGGGINLYLAWGYVGLRVLHSFIQSTSNNVSVRFPIWALGSLVLIAMTVRAAMVFV